MPAQAGIQWLRFAIFATEQIFDDFRDNRLQSHWVPACAGMTSRRVFRGSRKSLQRSGRQPRVLWERRRNRHLPLRSLGPGLRRDDE